jgi:hypothetical protein
MEDWMNPQQANREETIRGPRIGFSEPAEERPRRMKVFHETYSVFRPWSSCSRCKDAIRERPELLPEQGDYVCPHTRHNEYIELINRLRNAGDAGPWKLHAREFSNDRGEIYVTIAWEEPEVTQNEARIRSRGVPRL